MLFTVLLIISFSSAYLTNRLPEFELYDATNPNFVLSSRDDVLFLLYKDYVKVQNVNTVFLIEGGILKQGEKDVCSDGISGRVLRMCKNSDESLDWRIVESPEDEKIYILRDVRDSNKCAVYIEPEKEKQRNIGIDLCSSSDVIRFRLVDMNDYSQINYNGSPYWNGIGSHYNPLVPGNLTPPYFI